MSYFKFFIFPSHNKNLIYDDPNALNFCRDIKFVVPIKGTMRFNLLV